MVICSRALTIHYRTVSCKPFSQELMGAFLRIATHPILKDLKCASSYYYLDKAAKLFLPTSTRKIYSTEFWVDLLF